MRNWRGVSNIRAPLFAVPKIPITLRTGGFEPRCKNVASGATLFDAECVNVLSLFHKTLTKGNSVKAWQGEIRNRRQFGKCNSGPVIMIASLKSPHTAFASLLKRSEIDVNRFAFLKSTNRLEPLVYIG